MGTASHGQLDIHERMGESPEGLNRRARLTWQDLVIDWSLFRPNAKLLRRDKGYSNTYVGVREMVAHKR